MPPTSSRTHVVRIDSCFHKYPAVQGFGVSATSADDHPKWSVPRQLLPAKAIGHSLHKPSVPYQVVQVLGVFLSVPDSVTLYLWPVGYKVRPVRRPETPDAWLFLLRRHGKFRLARQEIYFVPVQFDATAAVLSKAV